MTQTQFVAYRDQGFWAYDVALGVFLKHLIDVAAQRRLDEPWLAEVSAWWRVVACVSDYGLTIDSSWSDDQVATFLDMVAEACRRLSERDSLSMCPE